MPKRTIDEFGLYRSTREAKLIRRVAFATVLVAAAGAGAQQLPNAQSAPAPSTPSTATAPGQQPGQIPGQGTAQPPVAAPDQAPAAQAPAGQPPSLSSPPIAIVSLDSAVPGSAISVAGAIQAWKGRAFFTGNGAITAGPATAQVTLPYRGTLSVCPSTTVNLSVDANAPSGEVPGLLMSLDGGALEASFAIARNSDVVLTPNLRILIGGPGSSDVKVRLGQGGDTCVDNSGANAPYVVVTSVFDSGLYRVQPGQRVMFEHGDLHSVVDDEKEPCGCPPPGQKVNEFPLAQSEGLAPILTQPPATATNQPAGSGSAATTLVYNAPEKAPQSVAIPQPPPAPPTTTQTPSAPAGQPAQKPAEQKKPGFFHKVGRFFKRVFGAE
jgi:hypothetical protein